MRRSSRWLAVLTGLIVVATLAACTSGVSEEDYNAALADWGATQIQLDESQIQVSALLADNEGLLSEAGSLQARIATLQREMNILQTQRSFIQRSSEHLNAWYTLGLSSGHSELDGCLSQEDIAQLEGKYSAYAMQ